jgi:murein DD-endopeptidase MepM/ murein hydrolase activator NlpD
MPERRWTVIIVPHGSDAPRTFTVSTRTLRVVKSLAATCLLVVLAGAGAIASQIWGMGAGSVRIAGLGGSDLADVATHISRLRDTLAVIRTREERIRLLAGLPSTDSAGRANNTETAAGDSAKPDSMMSAAELRGDVGALLRRADQLSARFAEVSDSLSRNAQRFANMPSIMPTAGWLTSQFSRDRKHPILHISRPHEGIDVSAPMGSPIIAPAAGRVVSVGRESGYGLTFEIDHGNGIVTKYAHCSRILVRQGQQVTRGMEIAAVGNTGLSTGPHLHYEIHVDGKVVDPLSFVLPEAIVD